MNFKSWCNISGMNMSRSKLLTLTLIISILWTSGALADQKSKPTSLSEATAEKLQQTKLSNNRDIYIDSDDDFEGSGRKGEVHDALENENDDADGSGSGIGDGDDEDGFPPKGNSHIKPDQGLGPGTHHSGDGSDFDPIDDTTDDDEHTESHEDHTNTHPIVTDDDEDNLYFVNNATDTDKPINPTTTDDEDIGGSETGNDFNRPKQASDPFNIDPTHPVSPTDSSSGSDNVLIMNTGNEDRTTSFFAQPGILAAVIGGAVVGLLFAILVVMFIVYRMRKKDEGSYALDEPQKRSPQANSYTKNHNNREFYA